MGAHVVGLRTRRDRKKASEAEELRQRLLAFDGLPELETRAVAAALDRYTPANAKRRTFVMMSPEDNAKVVAWLMRHSKQPMLAALLWSELFVHLDWNTGEIVKTRHELAETIGANADEVSRIMGELEGINAISRSRVKVAGMRGPGVVRYRMNSNVGTHLPNGPRERAQAKDGPLLRVMEGGRSNP